MAQEVIYDDVKSAFEMDKNGSYGLSCVETTKKAVATSSNIYIKCALMVVAALLITLILTMVACSIYFALEISHLKSQMLLTELTQNASFSAQIEEIKSSLFDETYRCNRLHNETVDVILNHHGRDPAFPVLSCSVLHPSSPSGYYWVRASNGSAVRVYCDMTRSCGGVTGGWMRVAELDMTNSSHQCPSGLTERTDSNIRTCVRNEDPPGCSSTDYSTSNIQYSRVCGKIIAYQYGAINAFVNYNIRAISSAYVDGISVTRGSPREHIWTFIAAFAETASSIASCPCIDSSAPLPPSFVDLDYFCDTGIESLGIPTRGVLFSGDPLWDGAGCGPLSSCCSFNTPPWFYKQLPHPTTDDIEMRVCRNRDASEEDVAIETIEIYVQ